MAIFTAKRWQVVMASPIASGGEASTPLLACVECQHQDGRLLKAC